MHDQVVSVHLRNKLYTCTVCTVGVYTRGSCSVRIPEVQLSSLAHRSDTVALIRQTGRISGIQAMNKQPSQILPVFSDLYQEYMLLLIVDNTVASATTSPVIFVHSGICKLYSPVLLGQSDVYKLPVLFL